MTTQFPSPRLQLRALFEAAIAPEAHGGFTLPPDLGPVSGKTPDLGPVSGKTPDLGPVSGKTIVIAVGKAAASHARLAVPGIRGPYRGLLVTPKGYGGAVDGLEAIEAGHPVPDSQSVVAASRALGLVEGLRSQDRVIVLLSGGGSALLAAPVAGVLPEEKQALTILLLRSGASISEINTVRKHLSRIKGGRLARAAYPAEVVTLAVSDVVGDDPATIASGPTVGDPTTLADARAVLAQYAIMPAPSIVRALSDPANETLKPGDRSLSRCRYRVIATPGQMLDAAARLALSQGFDVLELGSAVSGEARIIARAHAELALRQRPTRPLVILSGGEATVTVSGKGSGGPNREYLLALAMALGGAPHIHALAADTDGIDGAPTAAGAFVGPDTLSRAQACGLDPAAFLADNNTGAFFAALDDALVTGPTRTNLNDFRAILVTSQMIRP